MNITAIEIKNVKGIGQKSFAVDIKPNKPNLLVAPNGFGKSSIATAFSSMNSKRMTLDGENCHREDESNAPELAITVSSGRLVADTTKNEIRKAFDTHLLFLHTALEMIQLEDEQNKLPRAPLQH